MNTPKLPPLPERDPRKPAEQQGVFRKFDVRRTDGSSEPGGKHHGCEYFVLDVYHDPAARAALKAYADAVEATHPLLAADMRERYAIAAIQAQGVPEGWRTEAKKLAPILASMGEGGYDLETLYVKDPVDGDCFVKRAADLLLLLASAPPAPQAAPIDDNSPSDLDFSPEGHGVDGFEQAAVVQQAPVAYLDIGAVGYIDLGTDLSTEQLQALPAGRHMLGIIGTFGADGYVPAKQAKPQPLSDEQRSAIVAKWKGGNWTAGDIIDAVEAAHGIKE